MGLGGISIWELLIILAIVIMIFGTKRLGSIGSDLGSAIRNFKTGMRDDAPLFPAGDRDSSAKESSDPQGS